LNGNGFFWLHISWEPVPDNAYELESVNSAPLLVTDNNNAVPGTADRGKLGAVKLELYRDVPLTTLILVI